MALGNRVQKMSTRAHIRVLLTATLVWAAFLAAGWPSYYQQYSQEAMIWFDILLLAAPVYLVAAFEEERLVSMGRASRWWIGLSLTAGVVASLVAAPLTFFFGSWLWLFPAGTLAGCLVLYLRSERLWRLPPGEGAAVRRDRSPHRARTRAGPRR